MHAGKIDSIFLFPSQMCLFNLLDLEFNWQSTTEVANLLVCNDIKWSFGTSNQLHFYVVSSSNWGYNIQVDDEYSTYLIKVEGLMTNISCCLGDLFFFLPF